MLGKHPPPSRCQFIPRIGAPLVGVDRATQLGWHVDVILIGDAKPNLHDIAHRRVAVSENVWANNQIVAPATRGNERVGDRHIRDFTFDTQSRIPFERQFRAQPFRKENHVVPDLPAPPDAVSLYRCLEDVRKEKRHWSDGDGVRLVPLIQ